MFSGLRIASKFKKGCSDQHVETLNPIFLETVESVIVTSPDHILQSIEESNLLDYLSKYTKVVLDPSLEDTVKSAQTISAASLETVIKLVENGTGYTWLPKNLIKNQLNNHSLKQLKIANKNIYYDFYMYVNKNSLVQDVLGEFINHLELTEIK